jgi:DNA-binding transcriptional ArsR family regulator
MDGRAHALHMTPEAIELVAARFRVMGEPMRLRLLQTLTGGERSVSDLADALETTQPNVSKHLRVMQDAGLLARRQVKNTAYYSIDDPSVFELCDIVCRRLASRLEGQATAISARRRRRAPARR